MEAYANALLIAIPGFLVLILIEVLYGHYKGKQTYRFMDTLASLSSGVTNIPKDSLGLAIILISYPWLVELISVYSFEDSIALYIIAFICIDFAAYWGHRLNHHVNVFWNQHLIHHSSEEFNLACALRQSISNLIGYNALFLIPAAFIGIPATVINLLAPVHLFAQFWYHTKHIGKLGWLEYVLVTPSQHRVHHAINPIYVDKNLAAIFSVWDRLFGTFQEELEEEPPIYGTLKPSNTWNPILINFQHFWGLLLDAWHTKNWNDKLKIWFMPTGWRPADVAKRFPRPIVENVFEQQKYAPVYRAKHKLIAAFQFISLNAFIFSFLSTFGDLDSFSRIAYALLIFTTIFGFTSIMDGHKWALVFEITRPIIGLIILFHPFQKTLWTTDFPIAIGMSVYFVLSLCATLWMYQSLPERSPLTS